MSRALHAFLKRIVRCGRLDVETADGSRFAVGSGEAPRCAIRFADRWAEWALVVNPALALGELYTDGRIILSRGTIYDLLDLVASNLERDEPTGFAHALTALRTAIRPLSQHNTLRRAGKNVDRHYNLDGRLFDLFLDGDRQYSCAYFETPDMGLDEAQLAKKRHIAAKLLVKPQDRVLDIGCGWGGLDLYLAELVGAAVTGITLSEEQLDIARRRADALPPDRHVTFKLCDYRTVTGKFERIVSVGMFEHVGVTYFEQFFGKAAELLTDDGVMLLHSIGRMDGPGATNPWIEKHIFPGGYFPALSEVLPSIEKSGLIVTDVEILRLHYAATLRAWRERFLSHRAEALDLFGERFCRKWEFYLAASECGFRYCGLMVFQIQLARRQDAVPLTRDYVGAREKELRKKEQVLVTRARAAE